MSSTILFRLAARKQPSYLVRSSQSVKRPSPREVYAGSSATVACNYFSTTARKAADKDGQGATGGSGHHEETFEEFTARYGHLADRVPTTCLDYMSAQHYIFRSEATAISQLADRYLCPDMRKNLTVSKMSLNYRCERASPREFGPLNSDLSSYNSVI